MKRSKFWLYSKTFVSALVSALLALVYLLEQQEIVAVLPPSWLPYVPAAIVVASVLAAAFRTTADRPLSARRRDGERSTWST